MLESVKAAVVYQHGEYIICREVVGCLGIHNQVLPLEILQLGEALHMSLMTLDLFGRDMNILVYLLRIHVLTVLHRFPFFLCA